MATFRVIIFVLLLLFPTKAFSESKSYWARGMLIGAGSGAVVGGLTMGLAIGLKNCDPRETDLQFCGSKGGTMFGIAGALAGALIGTGIGAAVGVSIPKKNTQQNISIAPVIIPDDKTPFYGLSASCNF